MIRNYLNLTSGIEWIDKVEDVAGLVRIQSTWCEQKRWWDILADLGYGFLIDLVSGHDVVVYDASPHMGSPSKAIYMGIEWIRFFLNKNFGFIDVIPTYKLTNIQLYFNKVYNTRSTHLSIIRPHALKKIRYVSQFLNPDIDIISLEGQCIKTDHDGDYNYFKEKLNGKV